MLSILAIWIASSVAFTILVSWTIHRHSGLRGPRPEMSEDSLLFPPHAVTSFGAIEPRKD
jgi:hypothetical protein